MHLNLSTILSPLELNSRNLTPSRLAQIELPLKLVPNGLPLFLRLALEKAVDKIIKQKRVV